MKPIGIVGGGSKSTLPKDLDYIACDHGYDTLMEQGIVPIILIGDLDSIVHQEYVCPVKKLNAMKDQTDLEESIEYAINQGFHPIYVYGATGGRLDHFYSSLVLLQRFQDKEIILCDDDHRIRLIKDSSYLVSNHNQYVSIFALRPSLLTLKGFLYPLDEFALQPNNPLITSNELVDQQGEIKIIGEALLFQTTKKTLT